MAPTVNALLSERAWQQAIVEGGAPEARLKAQAKVLEIEAEIAAIQPGLLSERAWQRAVLAGGNPEQRLKAAAAIEELDAELAAIQRGDFSRQLKTLSEQVAKMINEPEMRALVVAARAGAEASAAAAKRARWAALLAGAAALISLYLVLR